jgi:hypothetical protein
MSLQGLDQPQLEAALRDAGRALGGARDDLADDVVAQLRSGVGAQQRRFPTPARRGLPRRLVPVLMVLVLLAGAAVAAGVAPGIGLRIGGPATPSTQTPLVADPAFLGTQTTLSVARDRVDFAVRVPALEQVGPPQVYHADEPAGGRVSLLYPAGDRLPAMEGTPVGLFLTQFRGDVDEDLLTKIVHEGADVTSVEIDGIPGWWIEGTHEVLFIDRAGEVVAERLRFSDNALLWTRDGVTVRLESALSRQQAIAIAASLR